MKPCGYAPLQKEIFAFLEQEDGKKKKQKQKHSKKKKELWLTEILKQTSDGATLRQSATILSATGAHMCSEDRL